MAGDFDISDDDWQSDNTTQGDGVYFTMTESGVQSHKGVPSLKEMQEIVGGYIEVACRIPLSGNLTMDVYCNDEGLLLELPCKYVRSADMYPIAGNLVAVGVNEHSGESVPLPEDAIEHLSKHFGVAVFWEIPLKHEDAHELSSDV